MGGNGQYRYVVAVTIEQTVDQMQVTWPTRSGADRQLAGKLGFRTGGKGSDFFVARTQPFDGAHTVQAVAEAVK
ncbi:hypothetical protein D3C71_1706820 [compost metagenome]